MQFHVGRDLIKKLKRLEFKSSDLTWVIPRRKEKNMQVKLQGILLAGHLSNYVIGIAIAQNKNIIVASNMINLSQDQIMEEFAEVLYQQNLYVLIWNWNWIISTIPGLTILARILQSDYQKVSKIETGVRVTYNFKIPLSTILQRFRSVLYYSLSELQDPLTDELYVYLGEQKQLMINADYVKEKYLLTKELPKNYTHLIKRKKWKIIIVDQISLINEVTRELYYLMKRNQRIVLDYELNKQIIVQVKK